MSTPDSAPDNPPVALTTADLRYLAEVMTALATWVEAKAVPDEITKGDDR